MNQIKKVAIIGECMVELRKTKVQLNKRIWWWYVNTAVYLSRLTQSAGVTTSYVHRPCKDPFSAEMLSAWEQEGLNTDMVFLLREEITGYLYHPDSCRWRKKFLLLAQWCCSKILATWCAAWRFRSSALRTSNDLPKRYQCCDSSWRLPEVADRSSH